MFYDKVNFVAGLINDLPPYPSFNTSPPLPLDKWPDYQMRGDIATFFSCHNIHVYFTSIVQISQIKMLPLSS